MTTIGHNLPPEPFVLITESIEDLLLEANNHLDGSEIETEQQEAAVASILTRLRRELNAADDMRKAEKRPHDEAAKAVQAKWAPLLSKGDLAVNAAKAALTKFLRKREDEARAVAEAAAQEARRQAEAAARAAEQARPDDLAGQTTVRVLKESAAAAEKAAEKASKTRVSAKGGERAVSLRTSYTAEITDGVAFARWAWEHRRPELLQFLEELADRECRHGPQNIPGINVITERKAA